jgi:hypothetical protein
VGESVIMKINKEITGIISDVLPDVAPTFAKESYWFA